MRSDIGMSTIAQRLGNIRALVPTAPPPAAAAPSSGAGSFADALSTQVEAQTGFASAGGAPGYGGTGAYGGVGYGGAGGAVNLGPGVTLNPAGAQISPQFPGAGGIGAVGGVGLAGGIGAPIGVAGVGGTPTGTRSGPPAELQAYGNGRIPASALQPLGVGDHSLWSPAARAYTDLAEAAARDGVTIGVNSSYRSHEQQQAMVDRYGLYGQGGRAAAPGSSNHGWGVSIDLQLDDQAQAWMRANAGQYGFVEDVPREPWHWTFTAASY